MTDVPDGAAFLLMDREKGEAVPVDRLPRAEWERLRSRILWNVGRSIGERMARGGPA